MYVSFWTILFFIGLFSNLSHRNGLIYYVYLGLDMLSSSNVKFNYISGISCIRKLHSKSKMGDTKCFLVARLSSIYTANVIKIKGMIYFWMDIMFI